MKKSQINHNALTHLIEADAVSVVVAKAMGDTWTLTVQVGDTMKIVMAKNSGKPRVWRKLDTLAKYLKDLGVDTFSTDVSKYDPSQKSLRRPDSANTLKQTHKSHQALQQSEVASSKQDAGVVDNSPTAEPQLKVNIQGGPDKIKPEVMDVTEPVALNATDKAIKKAKERWEHRRAKILQEENPRAK